MGYYELEFKGGVWHAVDYYADYNDDAIICIKATRNEAANVAEANGWTWVGA